MLIIVKLYPKYGLSRLWKELEAERKNLYLENVRPILGFRVEGQGHVSMMLDIKSIDAVEEEFLAQIRNKMSLRKTETVPLMSPAFFPLKEGVEITLEKYIAYLEVAPENYEDVYKKIMDTKFTNDTFAMWMSYSLGEEDIILFMFSDNRESTRTFISDNIEPMGGVKVVEIERVFAYMPMLSKSECDKLQAPFLQSQPPGNHGKLVNPDLYEEYRMEDSPMVSIVRLLPKSAMSNLWDEIESDISKFRTEKINPIFATYSEGRSHVSIIFEMSNFEVLRKFLVENIHTLENVRQTWTIPLMEAKYYELPEGHPDKMERYLMSVRADPGKLPKVREALENFQKPGELYQTFIAYSMGQYDIFSSILAKDRATLEDYAMENLDGMDGLTFYNITSQQKIVALASPEERAAHKAKFS